MVDNKRGWRTIGKRACSRKRKTSRLLLLAAAGRIYSLQLSQGDEMKLLDALLRLVHLTVWPPCSPPFKRSLRKDS